MSDSVYHKIYKSESPSDVVVVFFHDIGGSHESFDNYISTFTKNDANVLIFDYIGHGKSSGTRGHFSSVKEIKSFLLEIDSVLKSEFPKCRYFTLSIGQGSLIALYFSMLTDELEGNIFILPELRTSIEHSGVNKVLNLLSIEKLQYQLKYNSIGLVANNFITQRTTTVLENLLKRVQFDIYFIDCRNLIFNNGKVRGIFDYLPPEIHQEVTIKDLKFKNIIKKQDIIFKETYNWIYEN